MRKLLNGIVMSTSVTVLALSIPCFGGSPKAKTDFSGTWEMDVTRSESAHSSTASVPVTLVIKQTATELSIETRRRGQSETIIYKLDGSASEKPAEDNGPFEWRARWKELKLITETHRTVNRVTVTIEEILSLDAKAKELTVDRTLTVQHGYTCVVPRTIPRARMCLLKVVDEFTTTPFCLNSSDVFRG